MHDCLCSVSLDLLCIFLWLFLLVFVSPPGFSWQAYVILLLLSFLFFFNDLWEQRDLGNYKTDLHQIFRGGSDIGVDVQSDIGFQIGQGTLPWQPILGAKSAEIGNTPSFLGLAFHNGWQDGKADGIGHLNSTEVLSTSYKNLNFGPLTPEFTMMVW